MAILYQQEKTFKGRLADHIDNAFERTATADAQDRFNDRRDMMADSNPHWQTLRSQAAAIRAHVLDHLDEYLEEFLNHAEENGFIIHFAERDIDAAETVLDIIKSVGAQRVVKTKSMMSEEVGVNSTLLKAGIEVTETDLGEWILQLDDWDPPSHILAPAMHKGREDIHDLFSRYGYRGSLDVPEMTRFARAMLRERFLAADVGITGCNYAIASTGTVCIMTNEGNGRMATTLPETEIVLMGLERIVPSFAELDAMMQVFPQSAVGISTSSYLSLTNGPRKAGETDGPKEVHLVLIDNGRTDILSGPFRDMLRCIRCGTCQNVCPVYRHATGQTYGSIYEGPMGIVLTPLLVGYEQSAELPYASTLCGECAEHCPVKIPLHELILRHRQHIVNRGHGSKSEKIAMGGAALTLARGRRFTAAVTAGGRAMPLLAAGRDHLDEKNRLPLLSQWTDGRNLPLMKKETFRQWAKKNGKGGKK